MKDINKIFKIEIEEELLLSLKVAIQNEEIIKYICKNKNNNIFAILLSSEKLFTFSLKNKNSHTNVYTLDEIIKMTITEKKKFFQLDIFLENGDVISIEDDTVILFKEFVEAYEKLSMTMDTIFSKSKTDEEIMANIVDKNIDQPKKHENTQEKNNNFNKTKQSKIVNDNKISLDTTFSSNYLNDMFSKRNMTLPNGSLSNIDRIWTKVDSLEIDVRSFENNLVTKYEKLENLIKNNEDEISKINLYTKNELKKIIDTNKNDLSDALKTEISFILNKLESEILSINKNSENLANNIRSLKKEFDSKLISLKEDQIIITDQIKKALEDHKLNSNEIYVTQKAWIESNKFVKKNEDAILELETFFKKFLSKVELEKKENIELESLLKKIEFDFYKYIDENNKKSDDIFSRVSYIENELQDETQRKSMLKIIADIEDKSESQNKEIKLLQAQLKDVSNSINKSLDENNEQKINRNKTSKIKDSTESKKEMFVAKTYSNKGVKRFGLRSGQSIKKITQSNEIGLDALYVSNNDGKYLNIDNYDGLIFKGQKYYFEYHNDENGNINSFCEINHIDYHNGIRPHRGYQLRFYKDFVEYRVYDERGTIINDSDSSSVNYDLKYLTFFKE